MLIEITAYCRRTGMKETSFGRKVIQDPRLVGDLRLGRQLRPRTADRIRQFMLDNPEGFLNANAR